MGKVFEKPVMYVELFVANQAITTCTASGNIEWKFDCMRGPDVDTEYVISNSIPDVTASCTKNIGYANGIDTARDYYHSNIKHSNKNSKIAQWTEWGSKNQYRQVTYSGAQGLLYTDGDSRTDEAVWSVKTDHVEHSSEQGGQHHMVAPVIDSRTINASW